ncbi:hypothetical protein BJ508DRAFT_22523 [Ascobolus immersus RN42]|uniref:Uncharacterized protein n=1 Tax=Ascobolus immersus RN42 TaxID=1160509 RepID=A0A3N4HU52_ASCIM|nr:hypothetical protein BJ508DRAFT_22523 [Ascobolus immersus RN42]
MATPRYTARDRIREAVSANRDTLPLSDADIDKEWEKALNAHLKIVTQPASDITAGNTQTPLDNSLERRYQLAYKPTVTFLRIFLHNILNWSIHQKPKMVAKTTQPAPEPFAYSSVKNALPLVLVSWKAAVGKVCSSEDSEAKDDKQQIERAWGKLGSIWPQFENLTGTAVDFDCIPTENEDGSAEILRRLQFQPETHRR